MSSVQRNGNLGILHREVPLAAGHLDEQILLAQLDLAGGEGQGQAAGLVQLLLGSGAVQVGQQVADLTQLLAVLRPQSLELRFEGVVGEHGHVIGEGDLLHVQLVLDDLHIVLAQLLVGLHKHFGQRLAVLAVGAIAGGTAQNNDIQNQFHVALQISVHKALVHHGEVAQVHAFGSRLVHAAHQILIDDSAMKGIMGAAVLQTVSRAVYRVM